MRLIRERPAGPGNFGTTAFPFRLILVHVLLVVLVAPSMADGAGRKAKDLPERWRVWLTEEVYPLISSEQEKAFLGLDTEAQRRAYSERLWTLWGRQTGYGARFRAIYAERIALCRSLFDHMTDARARILLLHGPPDSEVDVRCDQVFHPISIWVWGYIEGLGEGVVALFYRPDGLGDYQFWGKFDGRQSLYVFIAWDNITSGGGNLSFFDRPESRCVNGDEILRLIGRAERWADDLKFMSRMSRLETVETAGVESSARRFMEFSALLDDDADPLDFTVKSAERGLRGGKIRVGFDLGLPAGDLGTTTVGDVEVIQVDVVGEISQDDRMVDRFRYLFSVPAAGDTLALILDRYLRPGDYTVRLKVEDVHSAHGSVREQQFVADVTAAEEVQKLEDARARTERDAFEVEIPETTGGPRVVRLVGPAGEAVSGIQRFEAVVESDEVRSVSFYIEDRLILTKNRPPFDVDLDLGDLPKLATVKVVGLGAGGEELGRAEIALNVGKERFFLNLHPISPDDVEGDRMHVGLTMNTPTDTTLERLEIYWNERLLTTLFQPPFEAWVQVGSAGSMGYLRALAVLDDGSQAEDLQFLNAPEFGTVVDVTSVELPVTVLTRAGKPVKDLELEDFRVEEDGVEQEIVHFSLQQDLPIRLGIVIDSSGSMEDTLPVVQRVVMGFLRDLLRPKDRAFIESFSDRPDILAPFTADFETLGNALLALYPDRTTAFYDATILGLFQFSGVRGRKAMVIVTDGEDTSSKYNSDAAKDFALRSGVTIYTIGIDIKKSKVLARFQLRRLAEITGGKSFFISSKDELDRIYEEIDEELRTQYRLVYTSTSTRPAEELREIKVDVDRRGTDVRTISGYYPGGF